MGENADFPTRRPNTSLMYVFARATHGNHASWVGGQCVIMAKKTTQVRKALLSNEVIVLLMRSMGCDVYRLDPG